MKTSKAKITFNAFNTGAVDFYLPDTDFDLLNESLDLCGANLASWSENLKRKDNPSLIYGRLYYTLTLHDIDKTIIRCLKKHEESLELKTEELALKAIRLRELESDFREILKAGFKKSKT